MYKYHRYDFYTLVWISHLRLTPGCGIDQCLPGQGRVRLLTNTRLDFNTGFACFDNKYFPFFVNFKCTCVFRGGWGWGNFFRLFCSIFSFFLIFNLACQFFSRTPESNRTKGYIGITLSVHLSCSARNFCFALTWAYHIFHMGISPLDDVSLTFMIDRGGCAVG